MYLTRLKFLPADMRRLRITDAYSIHRIVYSCFDVAEHNRILYTDKGIHNGALYVLILSPVPPQNHDTLCMETKSIPSAFYDHTIYRFEIVLNPVKRSNATRKMEIVSGLAPLLNYINAKAALHGFEIDPTSLQAMPLPAQQLEAKGHVNHAVRFNGVLKVADREKFRLAAENGIGRSRAFGFGLLELSPLQ